MATVIALFNMKGGTGRSTAAASLGYCYASTGRRVLLVDLDRSAGLTYMLYDPSSVLLARTVFDAFSQRDGLPVLQVREGLDLVPGAPAVVSLDRMCSGSRGADSVLGSLLMGVERDYDLILLDCPSGACLLLDNALSVCDRVLVPVVPDQLSYYGAVMARGYIDERRRGDVPPVDIFVNSFRFRHRGSASFLSFMRGQFGGAVLERPVRMTVVFPDSLSFLSPVPERQPESYGARDYVALAEEYALRIWGGNR